MANVFTDLPAPAGNGSGAGQDVSAMAALKTITVEDTFTGVVAIEVSNDGGATFGELTTFTRPGKRTIAAVAEQMRVTRRIIDPAAPGLPNIDVGADAGVTAFAVPAVPAGDGTGAPTDVSGLGEFNTVVVAGVFTGSLTIEISEDGVDYVDCLTFTTPLMRSKNFIAQFLRVTRANVNPGAPGAPVVAVGASPGAGGGGGGGADVISALQVGPAAYAASFGELVRVSGGVAFVVNLPAIAAGNAGQTVKVKEVVVAAGAPFLAISVTPDGADTIDAVAAAFVIATGQTGVVLESDGAGNWMIV